MLLLFYVTFNPNYIKFNFSFLPMQNVAFNFVIIVSHINNVGSIFDIHPELDLTKVLTLGNHFGDASNKPYMHLSSFQICPFAPLASGGGIQKCLYQYVLPVGTLFQYQVLECPNHF